MRGIKSLSPERAGMTGIIQPKARDMNYNRTFIRRIVDYEYLNRGGTNKLKAIKAAAMWMEL